MKNLFTIPIAESQLAANRGNALKLTGSHTAKDGACPAPAAREGRFASPRLRAVRSETDDDIDRITADLVRLYQPADCIEMFPIECLAVARQSRIRAERAKSAILAARRWEANGLDHGNASDTAVSSRNLEALNENLRIVVRFQKHFERRERRNIEHLRWLRSHRREEPRTNP